MCVSFTYDLYVSFQLGREHHGLKLITDALEDVQYKVGHAINEKKNNPTTTKTYLLL